jgi:hypothetical protein
MKPNHTSRLLAVCASLALSATAGLHAANIIAFNFTPIGTGLGAAGGGQTFKPSDATEAGSSPTLNLTEFSLWRGTGGTSTSQVSPTTYLVIYNGNPDTATQIGASSNSLNIGLLDAGGTQYRWTFASLSLDATKEYWAVLSNSPTDNNVLQPAGTWLQMSLQTITPNFTGGVSVIASRNKHQTNTTDLRFVATFTSTDAVFAVTSISVTQPDLVGLTFTSQAGKQYEVLSGTDPASITKSEGLVVANGPSTRFTRSAPLAGREFFRVADRGPAPPILAEGFESGDGGFTSANKGSGTEWTHGIPDSSGAGGSVSTGNAGSAKCWATNLGAFAGSGDGGFYTAGTDVCLRSPVLDLTNVTTAVLSFTQAMDIEIGHTAVVNIIDDTSETVMAKIHTSTPDPDTGDSPWQAVAPIPLPAIALGQRVRIEWRFTGDGDDTYLGWYIDDVLVTRQ